MQKLRAEYEKLAKAESAASSSTGSSSSASSGNSSKATVSSIKVVLSKGNKGDDVKKLQSALNDLGFREGEIDGSFGSNTEKALKKFQKDNKIKETGKLDDATKKKFKAKGYSGGTRYVPEFGIYEVDENQKEEIIVRTSSNGRLTTLEKGDGVIPANQTEKLMNLADTFDGNSQYAKLEYSDLFKGAVIDPTKLHDTIITIGHVNQMENAILKSMDSSISMAINNIKPQIQQQQPIQIGDIHIHKPIGSSTSLSQAIINELPMQVLQEIHKR